MLTQQFYLSLCSLWADQVRTLGPFFLAVGSGDPAWDRRPPTLRRNTKQLTREVARKQVDPAAVQYLTQQGRPTTRATTRLMLTVTFDRDEALGALREVGLFGGRASERADTGTLLVHQVHRVVNKTNRMTLARTLQLDLSPDQ